MQNKKSQMQMIETISVLFVFFILLILGFVFFAKIQGFGIKAQIEEATQKQAINIVQKASFLPELQCSEVNIREKNCVDIKKVEVVSGEAGIFKENEDYYFDIFGYATIAVKEVYPTDGPEFTIYNNDLSDYKSKLDTQVPILLKDPINKKYNFGLMTVTTYSK